MLYFDKDKKGGKKKVKAKLNELYTQQKNALDCYDFKELNNINKKIFKIRQSRKNKKLQMLKEKRQQQKDNKMHQSILQKLEARF